MSKTHLKKRLQHLNKVIDRKILAGKEYRKEMVEHNNIRKFLDHHENA